MCPICFYGRSDPPGSPWLLRRWNTFHFVFRCEAALTASQKWILQLHPPHIQGPRVQVAGWTCKCWADPAPMAAQQFTGLGDPPHCWGSLLLRARVGEASQAEPANTLCHVGGCRAGAHLPRDCFHWAGGAGRLGLQRASGLREWRFWGSRAQAHWSAGLVFSSLSPAGNNINIACLQLFQGTRRIETFSSRNNENLFWTFVIRKEKENHS